MKVPLYINILVSNFINSKIVFFSMKHNSIVIFILILLFLISQFIGLYVVGLSLGKELAFGIEKPQLEENTSFLYIFLIIIVVTLIALLLARFKAILLWKVWFFISVVLVLTISLSFFVPQEIAFLLSLVAAFFKIIKPHLLIHNMSELFLYGGIAALFVETVNIFSVSLLILLISLYDIYAVWKSKHMIKLAMFQSTLKIFSGFIVPYQEKKREKVALLGGGDIGFPLLFSGVILKEFGTRAFIIPFIVGLSLFYLLYTGEKNKFYPAMPYLGVGCFVGYGLVLLTTL